MGRSPVKFVQNAARIRKSDTIFPSIAFEHQICCAPEFWADIRSGRYGVPIRIHKHCCFVVVRHVSKDRIVGALQLIALPYCAAGERRHGTRCTGS